MNIAIFVLADLFVPLMLSTGRHLESQHGHSVSYLNFLPHDHRLLSKNTQQLFPRHLASMDGWAEGEDMFSLDEVEKMTGFMQAKHGGTLQEWHSRTNRIARFIDRFIEQERPDVFVLWNGQDHIGQVINNLCQRHGIPTVYLENGYFANTLQVDLCGVNAAASLAQITYPDVVERAQAAPPQQMDGGQEVTPSFKSLSQVESALIALAHHANPHYYGHYPEQRGSSRIKSWQIKQRRANLPVDEVALPEVFAFIPFQVHDDTQVLLNSKLVGSVEAFFREAHAAIRRVLGPDYPIVVKEHPEDLVRYDYGALRREFSDVIWLRKADIEVLLDRASMVVVINSSVGLQAVRRKKPTVVLGESFYSKPEIAFVVPSLGQLDEMVLRASQGVDSAMAQRIERFVDALGHTLFVDGTWKYPACLEAAPALARRIVELVDHASMPQFVAHERERYVA